VGKRFWTLEALRAGVGWRRTGPSRCGKGQQVGQCSHDDIHVTFAGIHLALGSDTELAVLRLHRRTDVDRHGRVGVSVVNEQRNGCDHLRRVVLGDALGPPGCGGRAASHAATIFANSSWPLALSTSSTLSSGYAALSPAMPASAYPICEAAVAVDRSPNVSSPAGAPSMAPTILSSGAYVGASSAAHAAAPPPCE
jgi:hypothetical protein